MADAGAREVPCRRCEGLLTAGPPTAFPHTGHRRGLDDPKVGVRPALTIVVDGVGRESAAYTESMPSCSSLGAGYLAKVVETRLIRVGGCQPPIRNGLPDLFLGPRGGGGANPPGMPLPERAHISRGG